MTPIRPTINLPPKETVAAFRARGILRTQTRWDETWQAEHARAFTVTKLLDLQLLGAVRASLDKVVSEGGTFAQWQAGIVPQLTAAGWYGRVENAALTGTPEPVFIDERRLRTIYDTNLRMARAAGKWARIQTLKARAPYLMWDAIGDNRTRPLHRLWGGLDTGKPIILPVDHPAWDLYYPPCGWGCRCGVIQLSDRDLTRQGLTVTTDAELVAIGWLTAELELGGTMRRYQRSTGEVVDVPEGIDPGFAYNPGIASLRALAERATSTLETAAATGLAAARETLADLVDSPAFDLFMAEPEMVFPVMILDDAQAAMLGADARVVRLSKQTFDKQEGRRPGNPGHRDLGADIYRQLPDMPARAVHIFQREEDRIIFMRTEGGRWLMAVVKRTRDGRELYLTSYRWSNANDLRRFTERYPDLLRPQKSDD